MGRPARIGLVTAALLAAGQVGCAQLAGIDETTAGTPPEMATLTIDRVSIGANIVESPLVLTGLTAHYLIANPDAPDGFDRIPMDTIDVEDPKYTPNLPTRPIWTAEVGEAEVAAMFTVPDYPEPTTRIWQMPSRNLVGAFNVYEHPDPTPAPDPAMLTVQATLPTAYAATESFRFQTVGTWTARGFSGVADIPVVGATTFGPVAFAYSTTSRQTNRPYEQITMVDTTLLLRYVATRLTGVMEGTPFEQTGADSVMGTMTAVAATQTLTATLNNTTVAVRYTPLRPAMPAPAMSWAVVAAPGYASASLTGVTLNSDAVLAADPSAISVPYGNPFESKGWREAMQWSTSSNRTFTPAGAAGPATLSAGLTQVVLPTPGMALDLPAGLPELITLDQIPLSTDGVAIAKPIKALSASFVVPPTPVNSLYQLQVFELVPNMAGTALDHKHLVTIASLTPQFLIPPEFFQASKAYTLRAIAQSGGYPNAAEGDFATRALPFAQGYMDSGVITVNP